MRGLIPCAVLVELERRTGKPCCDLFDLIAGTSIGGILAALLASGLPASECLKFFTVDGPQIFRRRWWRYFGLTGPRYPSAVIEEILFRRFQGLKVQTRLLIPSLDLATQQPYFFKFSPHRLTLPRFTAVAVREREYELWQAARATSAAQTYFPAFKTLLPDGAHVFWDGGNVANNPALCAYADAVKLWDDKLLMLSLGTGAPTITLNADRLVNAGMVRNGLATVELLFAAGSEQVDYQMQQLLGGAYHRIEPDAELPLDDASPDAILNLKSAAVNCLRQAETNRTLERFLARARN